MQRKPTLFQPDTSEPAIIYIRESRFESLNIDPAAPPLLLVASNLITCFAYLFLYKTRENSSKALLYHAIGGFPIELNQIVAQIAAEANLAEVQLVIAMPAERYDQRRRYSNEAVLQLALDGGRLPTNALLQGLREFGMTMAPTIVKDAPQYCVNNRGEHGIVIAQRLAPKLEARATGCVLS